MQLGYRLFENIDSITEESSAGEEPFENDLAMIEIYLNTCKMHLITLMIML